MPSNNALATFDTESVHPTDKPQLTNAGSVPIPPNPPHYVVGLTRYDQSLKYNVRLQTTTDNYAQEKFSVHLDAWSDSIFYGAQASLFQINEDDRDFQTGEVAGNGAWTKSVTFKRAYAAPPNVVIWLTGFDFERQKNFRIEATAEAITNTGFNLKVETWRDTHLYSASATWIAHPSNHPTVASGTISTRDIRPSSEPRLETLGKVTYPSGKFVGNVQLVYGISGFDVDANSGDAVRFKVETKKEIASGFEWGLNSWANTVLYALTAQYIALQV